MYTDYEAKTKIEKEKYWLLSREGMSFFVSFECVVVSNSYFELMDFIFISNVSLPSLFSGISLFVLCVNISDVFFSSQMCFSISSDCTFMFVHVTCEHVKHDYAPVYTIDVALPNLICTEQKVVLDTTEGIGLFVLGAIQYINFFAWTCCSLICRI